jgi:D-serine deaminase-like pyridoxal phosphate-dependent protein
MRLEEFDTPFVAVDLNVLGHNIERYQTYCDEHGIAFRPHIKTHKIPAIAHRQVAAGAVGIACQKLGEAEVMMAGGIEDISICYNIVGRQKLERLRGLAHEARISVAADSDATVEGLSEAFASEPAALDVIVECDAGGKRCGVQTPEEALRLAQKIDRMPGLRFAGLMIYPTRRDSMTFVAETLDLLELAGLEAEIVSGGGSTATWWAHEFEELTEHRAGTYIYNDVSTVGAGIATWEECAALVHVTVVSTPTPDRIILDGGSKTFTNDYTDRCGHILEHPDARFDRQNEEHGIVDTSGCNHRFGVGERLHVVPAHACGMANLHDEVVVHRFGEVEARWPVLARGKIR